MNLFNIFILIFAVMFLSGCGGATPSPLKKKAPTPAWITSILPDDTATKMFGMATAKNREMAIKAALADMIAREGTTIEANYHSKEVVKNFSSSSVVNYDIKSEVSKIPVNNYKVIKSYKLSYKEFAVMIETDKKKFIQGLKDDLMTKKKTITQRDDSLKSQDALTRYNGKKELSTTSSKLVPMILMIAHLDKNFNKDANLNFVSQEQKHFLDEKNSLKFYVKGNDKSTVFADKIKNYLAQMGMNVVNSEKNAVLVKLETSDNVNNSSVSIAVINLKVSVYDKSQHIGGKTIIMKERYNSSMASVYKNAAIHFEQDMKSKGINELIGINLDTDTKH